MHSCNRNRSKIESFRANKAQEQAAFISRTLRTREELDRQLQAEQERRDIENSPQWGVTQVWGQHSFSGCFFGYKITQKAGLLTYFEASNLANDLTKQSSRAQNNIKFWHEFLNG